MEARPSLHRARCVLAKGRGSEPIKTGFLGPVFHHEELIDLAVLRTTNRARNVREVLSHVGKPILQTMYERLG
jgi:hypothetical protein